MTPAEFRRQLQSLYRRLQTAALDGSPSLAVFTHDYGLLWLETPAGHDEQQEQVRRWQRFIPEERWLLPIDPFYLPLTGKDWAGFPRLEQVDERVRKLPEALLTVGNGQTELLCREPQLALEKLIMAEAEARQDALNRVTAVSNQTRIVSAASSESCWNCDRNDPDNCVGSDCVNFSNHQSSISQKE
jgi:hypothetical protein